eukprot:TRINITY_DN8187_c0_g1_i2.p1 TRINITY_DN8187_c0_g1~~TRINITY_DN8187_c0_g1_i2.p1  ORF type:complete len:410 (+),score=87.57 TRINITY_DN8187_c0_g1_i2:81-1310(+)
MTAVDASSANASSCVAAAAASAVFSCVLRGRDGDENEDDHVVDRRKKFSCNLARFRGDTESSSSGEDAEVYRRPPPVSSRAPTTQPSALVTRDRSNHFQRLRSMRQQRSLRKLSTEQRMSAVDRAAASLSRSYHAAVQTHASLGTKLAQHNGLRQFGVEFKGRAPPLELRMLLPDLENSIHDQLEELEEFATRLDGLTFSDELGHARPETAKLCKVRDEALANLRRITEEVKATFEEQRCHLQELAAASPLLSTRFSAELGRRFSKTIVSPSCSRNSSPNCSPWPSPKLPQKGPASPGAFGTALRSLEASSPSSSTLSSPAKPGRPGGSDYCGGSALASSSTVDRTPLLLSGGKWSSESSAQRCPQWLLEEDSDESAREDEVHQDATAAFPSVFSIEMVFSDSPHSAGS